VRERQGGRPVRRTRAWGQGVKTAAATGIHTEPDRSDRPRLLVTTSTLPRWAGDPEPRFVLDLARHLREWFEPTILAPAYPGAKPEERLHDVSIRRYRYGPLRALETLCYPGGIMPRLRASPCCWLQVPLLFAGLARAMRQELARRRYACVHCHWFAPQGLVQALGCGPGIHPPFVVTSHGGDMALADSALLRPPYRRVLRRSAAVTAVSSGIIGDLERLDPGFRAASVPVIPMGVDVAKFSPAHRSEGWAAAHGLERPVMLFVGRLVAKKGVSVLLDALAHAPLNRDRGSLVIAGEGPARERLETKVRELSLESRIRFIGSLPHSKLLEVYASCDVLCAPSVRGAGGDRDGLPVVLIEGAASGLPLVGTTIGDIPRVVVTGRTGILVPPGDPRRLADALHRLVTDTALRERLGRGARDHALGFSWSLIAARYAEVIHGAIESRIGAARGGNGSP